MSNYSNLKTAIANVVKTNGNNEITGALLQQTLFAMVNSLAAGYIFAGVAQTSTNPGTPDQRVFYIAMTPGVYSNFNGVSLIAGQIGIFYYDSQWHTRIISVGAFVNEIYAYGVPASSADWVDGKLYYNRVTHLLRLYRGGSWETIPFVDGAIYVLNNRFVSYDASVQDLVLYPMPVIPLSGLSIPSSPVFGKFYFSPTESKIRFYPRSHENGRILVNMDTETFYSFGSKLYYWNGSELVEYLAELTEKVYVLERQVREVREINGINTLFTISGAGIRADSSRQDFGEQIAISGDFACCPFVDYIPTTPIRVRYGTAFSSFGLVFYDENRAPLVGHVFSSNHIGEDLVFSHPTAKYFRSSRPNTGATYFYYSIYGTGGLVHEGDLEKLESRWKGKKILWLGTSIPQGGYPEIVADFLGATVINKAVGSSVCRAYHRDGTTITGPNGERAFSQTIAEKNSLYGSGYSQYSFESILIPYLDGTHDAPDIIVLEYGADSGQESNLNEMPLLNEDCTGPIGADSLTQSLGINFNRCTYTGAMLFIINTILQYLPFARIVVIGYQNEMRRPQQVQAQETVANYWQIPLFATSPLLGWSDRIVPGSMAKFNAKYSPTYTASQDVTQFRMWCPDDFHPHSNPTLTPDGYLQSNYELARKIIAMFNEI